MIEDKPNLEKYTILKIEEVLIAFDMLEIYLKDCGATILNISDGETGLKKTQHTQPDLIFLDMFMTGMDGFEICQKLKSNNKTKHIPVIFMVSLKNDNEDRTRIVKLFEVGGLDYILKPYHELEIWIKVKSALKMKG